MSENTDTRKPFADQLAAGLLRAFPGRAGSTVSTADAEKALRRGLPIGSSKLTVSKPGNPAPMGLNNVPRVGTSTIVSSKNAEQRVQVASRPAYTEAAVDVTRQIVHDVSDEEIRELDEDDDLIENQDDDDDDNGYDDDNEEDNDDDDNNEDDGLELSEDDSEDDGSEEDDDPGNYTSHDKDGNYVSRDEEDDDFEGEALDETRTPREVLNALLDGMAVYFHNQLPILSNPLIYGLAGYDDVRNLVRDLNSTATAIKDVLVKAGVEVPFTAYPGYNKVRSELPDNKIVFTAESREPISLLIVGLLYYAKNMNALKNEVEGYRSLTDTFSEQVDARDSEIENLRAQVAQFEADRFQLVAENEDLQVKNSALESAPSSNNDGSFSADRIVQLEPSVYMFLNPKLTKENSLRYIGIVDEDNLAKWNSGEKVPLKAFVRVASVGEAIKTVDTELVINTLKRFHKFGEKLKTLGPWFKNPLSVIAAEIVLYNQVPEDYDPTNPGEI